jgi:acetyl-CoA carboxylase biotin carboxyl carrier protein
MAEDKGENGRTSSMKVDSALVRELAELLNETGLTEIEVEDGDRKIRVSRGVVAASAPAAPAPLPAPGPAAAAAPMLAESATPDYTNAIRSPMVGTAYLTPEPGSEPFIRIGDRVKAGDTLLIVEAMKVMNPIAATSEGIVQEILIENAQPVEFDQPLIVLG